MEVLKDEEKSESTMSDLDDMWYTGDKESNIQVFQDEDWDDNEDFKEGVLHSYCFRLFNQYDRSLEMVFESDPSI
jgi:hypothetical protein